MTMQDRRSGIVIMPVTAVRTIIGAPVGVGSAEWRIYTRPYAPLCQDDGQATIVED